MISTREQILVAQGRELDRMVAEEFKDAFSGYPPGAHQWVYYPRFHSSRDAAAEVTAEVERRGLKVSYLDELADILGITFWQPADHVVGPWLIHTAPPAAICKAALLAHLKEGEGR